MNDQDVIHIIESTQRRLDREQAPHFAGSYGSDAAAICRALREAGALE
ncbi:hypothetical protein [Galactobacter sp.]|nr:hypothetical protein [Galactobacter sp.]